MSVLEFEKGTDDAAFGEVLFGVYYLLVPVPVPVARRGSGWRF